MDCREYREIISAHVDGALSAGESLVAQSHIEQCPPCARMFLWESRAASVLKRKLSPIPARPALRLRVLEQLGERRKTGIFGWSYMAHGLAAAFALLLIVAVPYLYRQGEVPEDIFMDAIVRYQKVAQGAVSTPQNTFSFTPAARLLDLSPWGYRILSRQTERVKGQEGRVFVYRGQGREYLLAQEFEGVPFSPPAGGRIVRASSRDFVSYSRAGVNLVAWKDRDLLCILTSTLPPEKLLGLARQVALGG